MRAQGRGHESDVRIPDVSISRYHATIRFVDGSFQLEDHNSKFGTLVSLRKAFAIGDTGELPHKCCFEYIYICICMYMYIYVCTYIYMNVHMCILYLWGWVNEHRPYFLGPRDGGLQFD